MASRNCPHLDWLQVEVTTRCNAACVYCPRTVFRDRWRNNDLPMDLFGKALPIMRKARIVHLQGWGEPFLHPEFFAMVRLAKKQGCAVSTTTNGMLIDESHLEEIFASGLDMISFSLAGFGEANDRLRMGTESAHVTSIIRKLYLKKRALGRQTPKIHVSYMLLSSALREAEKIPQKLAGIGVDEVIVSTLDFIAAPHLQDEAIRPVSQADYAWLCDELNRVGEQCRRAGLQLHFRLPSPAKPRDHCTENILKSAFIRTNGTVMPCVFMSLPGEKHDFYDGEQIRPYDTISYGSLAEAPFHQLWSSPAAEQFRNSFRGGEQFSLCRSCPKRTE